jgi:hypothetical protein
MAGERMWEMNENHERIVHLEILLNNFYTVNMKVVVGLLGRTIDVTESNRGRAAAVSSYKMGVILQFVLIENKVCLEVGSSCRFSLSPPPPQLQTEHCKLQTVNSQLQTPNCKLSTANCKLPTAN